MVIGDFNHEHKHRHHNSALGYRTPAEYAAATQVHLHPGGLPDHDHKQPDSKSNAVNFAVFAGKWPLSGKGVAAVMFWMTHCGLIERR